MSLILQHREDRYNRVMKLARKYKKPIICGKLNYPGTEKNSVATLVAFSDLKNIMGNKFSEISIYEEADYGVDGCSFIIVSDVSAEEVKKIAVEIESNHEIGRIFDIDVYNVSGESLSRESLGLPERQCIICEASAKVCVRSEKHSTHDLVKYTDSMVNMYF